MDDDVYKMRQDPSVTVTFPLVGRQGGSARAHRRARARVDDDALDAAHQPRPGRRPRHPLRRRPRRSARRRRRPPRPSTRDAAHEHAEAESHRYLLAEDLLPSYAKDLGYETAEDAAAAVEAVHLGADLADVHYDRLFDYYADAET